MRKLLVFLILVALVVGLNLTTTGCGKMDSSTAPLAMSPTPFNDQLPLVNGQGPPQETPPDSIVSRAKEFLRRAGPLKLIGGVSSTTIVNNATTWIGVPYYWGGNSRSGIDCSHLVYQVYRQSGLSSYPYLTTDQMKRYSRFICVNWDDWGGDIVLFTGLSHTGIYMGGGWMIDANSRYGVTWDNLNSSYWQFFHPYPVRYVP